MDRRAALRAFLSLSFLPLVRVPLGESSWPRVTLTPEEETLEEGVAAVYRQVRREIEHEFIFGTGGGIEPRGIMASYPVRKEWGDG